jgi:TolB-like protein
MERGLPVHRVPGSSRGVVYAFTDELEDWLQNKSQAEANQSGPRLSGSVAVAAPASADVSSASPAPARARYAIRFLPLLVAGALAIAVFAGVYSYRRTARFQARAAAGRPSPRRDSVAVLPFTNVGGSASTDYLSDGITESLIGNLARIPQLKVRSRDAVFRYKGKDVEVRKAGGELEVSAVVSGRVMLQGDSIEVSAELTDVRDNTAIWGHHYAGRAAELISLQQRMAGDIAETLRSTLSSAEKQQVTNQGTEDPEAYSLYLKGRYVFHNRTFLQLQPAIALFNQAIAKDPGYALAYAGLADVYSVLPDFGGDPAEEYAKSNAAARRALQLDPTLAHPHAVLGSNEMGYDWDFAGGEAEFKKAIELDPNDATAHQWYAERLGAIGGREKEAWAEINLAHQLDPQSLVIRRVMGSVLVMGRRFDDAIAVCKQLESEDPSYTLAHDCLAYGYWGKHMYPQLVEEWTIYGRLTGNHDDAEWGAALDRGFRSGGRDGALAEAARSLEARRKTGYGSPYEIARIYADLGEAEKAFQWLDIAYREHDWLLCELNTGFQLDVLRSDPRFSELVRKVGLPKAR